MPQYRIAASAVFAVLLIHGATTANPRQVAPSRATTPRALSSAPPFSATPPRSPTTTVVPPYRLPVVGEIVDGWRPPENPYGAGNRGVDIRTQPGDVVVAANAGEVTFAGQVGGILWVVVRHSDGVRTTVGPLASILVAVGQQVGSGQAVGTASGPAIHFGARQGSGYIDPLSLLPRGSVRLIPTR